MKHTPAGLGVLAAAVLAVIGAVVPAVSASAATSAGWADWDELSGSAGDWSTTMRLPAGGFPAATMTSDSRGGVGVVSGESVWLSEATPPGEVYGSSRGMRYLNLRPQADRPTSPSTTTYSFERPTPGSGWAFVLGDIDADRAVVTARGEDGRLLAGAELGWQGGFNYCSAEGSPSCTGTPEDVPTWDPATRELLGNLDTADTSGAAGWFRPTTPIKSLTIEFHQRSGFPVYQTWFAARTGSRRTSCSPGRPSGRQGSPRERRRVRARPLTQVRAQARSRHPVPARMRPARSTPAASPRQAPPWDRWRWPPRSC